MAKYDINSISVAQILRILTASMKKLHAKQQDISLMQKEFLNQFGIEVSDNFIPEATYEISNEKTSLDVEMIQNFLKETKSDRVCPIMIWKYALQREGKPTKAQSIEIGHVVDVYCDGWKRTSPFRSKEFGSQRGWKRADILDS